MLEMISWIVLRQSLRLRFEHLHLPIVFLSQLSGLSKQGSYVKQGSNRLQSLLPCRPPIPRPFDDSSHLSYLLSLNLSLQKFDGLNAQGSSPIDLSPN